MSNDVCNGGIQSLCSWGSARKSHHKLSHDILQEEDSCVLPSCDIIPIALKKERKSKIFLDI